MADWSVFYADLLPHVKGCAEPSMDLALRRSASEYFRRTMAWCEWLSPFSIQASTRTYALTLPTGSLLVRLERVTLNGRPIELHSYRSMEADPARYPDQDSGVASADRISITTLQQYAVGDQVQVQALLTCSEAATGIPDALFTQHVDGIVAGAKRRLMQTPDKPYTNVASAMDAGAEFESAVDAALSQSYKGELGRMPRARVKWC